MSIEKPDEGVPGDTDSPNVEAEVAQPEKERSEDERQTTIENACREKFISEWVMSSALTPEQKVSVVEYINAKPGAWREYNGTDFKVIEANIEEGIWKVSFGLYFDDFEAQRIDVEIPVSG
jgi:hypothetical protein